MMKVSVIPIQITLLRNDKKNGSNVPKDDRFKELQDSLKDLHPEAHQPKVKKNIVTGDSVIKNVNGRDVSGDDSVKFDLILGINGSPD